MSNANSQPIKKSYIIASNHVLPAWPVKVLPISMFLLPITLLGWAGLWAIQGQEDWAVVVILGGLGFGLFGVLLRVYKPVKKTIFKTTNHDLDQQVRPYREMKHQDWESTIEGLIAKPDVHFLYADRWRLADPRTWNREQGIVQVFDDLLSVTLCERNGIVGKVTVELRGRSPQPVYPPTGPQIRKWLGFEPSD